MLKKFLKSYSNRMFIIFLSFSLALLVILCLVQSVAVFGTYQSSLKGQGEVSVESTSAALTTVLTDYTSTINSLCEEENIQTFLNGRTNEDTQIEILKDLYFIKNSFSQQADVSVIELSSNTWITTGDYEKFSSHRVYSNWGIFRNANETSEVAVYAFSKDAVLKAQDRICLAKVYRSKEGEILGYVLVEITRSALDTLIKEYNSVYNTSFMLVNKNGSIVYHSKGVDWEGVGKIEKYGKLSELKEMPADGMVWGSILPLTMNWRRLIFCGNFRKMPWELC